MESFLEVAGLYSTYDSIIQVFNNGCIDPDDRRFNQVLYHEMSHYFQNHFTSAGNDCHNIIGCINDYLEDLLQNETRKGIIKIPFLKWLNDPGTQKLKEESIDKIFRIELLLSQLNHGFESTRYMKNNQYELSKLDIIDVIQNGNIKVNCSDNCLYINSKKIFRIDYNAICESMAKSMELRYAAYLNLTKNGVVDVTNDLWEQELLRIAQNEILDPSLLNYYFPAIIIRSTNTKFFDAFRLIIWISFIALTLGFSIPPIPELNNKFYNVRFDEFIVDAYVKLMNYAYTGRLYDDIKSNANNIKDMNVVKYFDMVTARSKLPKFSQGLDAFYKRMATIQPIYNNSESLNDKWYGFRIGFILKFIEDINELDVYNGLNLIEAPFDYLLKNDVAPIMLSRQGRVVINQANIGSTIDKGREGASLLHNLYYTLLFSDKVEPRYCYQNPLQNDSYNTSAVQFLKQQYGITNIEKY